MVSRSESIVKVSKHHASGGRYENLSANNHCILGSATDGFHARKQCICQGWSRRPWVARGDWTMARPGMGSRLVGSILPILLSILLPVLFGAADSNPAAARRICTTGSAGRAAHLLVFLQKPAGLLPVCETVSERLDEGCADSPNPAFFSDGIKR